jgi:hypothetical protein
VIAEAIVETLLLGVEGRKVPRVLTSKDDLYQEVLDLSDDFYREFSNDIAVLGLDDDNALIPAVDAILQAVNLPAEDDGEDDNATEQAPVEDQAAEEQAPEEQAAGEPSGMGFDDGEGEGEGAGAADEDEDETVDMIVERTTPTVEGIADNLADAAVAAGLGEAVADAFDTVPALASWVMENGNSAHYSARQNIMLQDALDLGDAAKQVDAKVFDLIEQVVPEGSFALDKSVQEQAADLSDESLVSVYSKLSAILAEDVVSRAKEKLDAGEGPQAADNDKTTGLPTPDELRKELSDKVSEWLDSAHAETETSELASLDAVDESLQFMNEEADAWQGISSDLAAYDPREGKAGCRRRPASR